LLTNVRNTPGVEDAASASIVQVSGDGWNDSIEFLGKRSGKHLEPWFDRVSTGYFRTMGTPLIAGRDFDDQDTTSSQEVAIVNEEFSHKFLAGKNPLGVSFRILTGPGEQPHVYQIVGLVKNSKYRSLRDDFQPIAFVAATQDKEPGLGVNVVVRSHEAIGSLTAALRRTMRQENSGISFEFQVFKTQVQDSLLRERLMAMLSGFFGFLAAALATVGLYGVISYMVARRRSEIGIRVALGATRSQVMKLVMTEASLLLIAGLVIGAALSVATAQTTSSFLYGLRPSDPTTMAIAVIALACIALAASFLPALRAARLEPMDTLREE
jgi:predicted permease